MTARAVTSSLDTAAQIFSLFLNSVVVSLKSGITGARSQTLSSSSQCLTTVHQQQTSAAVHQVLLPGANRTLCQLSTCGTRGLQLIQHVRLAACHTGCCSASSRQQCVLHSRNTASCSGSCSHRRNGKHIQIFNHSSNLYTVPILHKAQAACSSKSTIAGRQGIQTSSSSIDRRYISLGSSSSSNSSQAIGRALVGASCSTQQVMLHSVLAAAQGDGKAIQDVLSCSDSKAIQRRVLVWTDGNAQAGHGKSSEAVSFSTSTCASTDSSTSLSTEADTAQVEDASTPDDTKKGTIREDHSSDHVDRAVQPELADAPGRPLPSILAAATQRLAAAPSTLTNPLLRSLDAGMSQHTTHALPDYQHDEQQQHMLQTAVAVIDRLRANQHSAFIVGGFVRDVYMERRFADIDIATSASPSHVRKIFKGDYMIDLPRSTVRLTHQGQSFELSFFKGVSRASNLMSLGMDAGCRDFTLNSLYYDPHTNVVLDFVGGVKDVRARTLRLVRDDVRRLVEDPLRVLRGVRFATVLGLKLAPGTALAMKQHAHMCSVTAGVPPRRVWLELRKLAKAEAQRPGSWPSALKLSYHLGLLPHMFPWLQQQGQPTSSRRSPGLDPFGQSRLPVSAVASSSNDSSSDQSPGKAVAVAKQLSALWAEQQQQQQQGEAGVSEDMPLCLLVAATIHPSKEGYTQADTWLQQLFPEEEDQNTLQVLRTAAQLLTGTPSHTSSGSSGLRSHTGPGDAFAGFYSHTYAAQCVTLLSCWLPQAFAARFLREHMARVRAAQQQAHS